MNSQDGYGTNVDVDADIANMGVNSSAAQIHHIPDTSPQSLMEKFQKQQALEKMQRDKELQSLQAEEYPREAQIRSTAPVLEVPHRLPDKPLSLREQINEMEAKLGMHDAMPANGKIYNAQSFLDDLGDETFYVQNTSNGHVLVTDLELKIPRGKTLDLLKFCDLESIKKSKDIRVALAHNPKSGPMIKRLTPSEYLTKMDQEYKESVKIENFKKTSALRAAQGNTGDNKYMEPVKPVVYDKLNKLKLSYSDTPHKGISPVEFAQWVQTEDLNKADLDQILAQIDDNELRILVNERKKAILERS